jgi:hypothetical protein
MRRENKETSLHMFGECMKKGIFIEFATIWRKGRTAKVVGGGGGKVNKIKTQILVIEIVIFLFGSIPRYYI